MNIHFHKNNYVICGLLPNKPKNCIVLKTQSGRSMISSIENIKNMLKIPDILSEIVKE